MALSQGTDIEDLREKVFAFNESQLRFQVVETLSPMACTRTLEDIFILDACFNPPTSAHLSLVLSAVDDSILRSAGESRLVLLFCTNGTKRAPSPATVEDRLHMIKLLVTELHRLRPESLHIPIDIALTKETTFVKKSIAITAASRAEYPALYSQVGDSHSKPRQTYVVGSDNFLRVLQPEFYAGWSPPLSALAPLFDPGHEILCSMRPETSLSSAVTDDQHLALFDKTIRCKETEGFKETWIKQVRCIKSPSDCIGVSSTAVRNAAKAGDWQTVSLMCPPGIADYVKSKAIYANDARGLKHAQTLVIGISGCTSSVKTTLTALLRRLLPEHTVFIHGDVFGRPLEEMPVREGFPDCDSRQSVRTGDLKATIEFTKANGKAPATYQSFQALETDLLAADGKIDSEVLSDLSSAIECIHSTLLHYETIIVVDGFMLYHDKTIRSMIDIKILLRASREESWRRRSKRYGNMSEQEKEFWQTKAYFDACVWYNHELEHKYLFPDGDIGGDIHHGARTDSYDIKIQPKADLTISETHRWAVDAIIEGVKQKTC